MWILIFGMIHMAGSVQMCGLIGLKGQTNVVLSTPTEANECIIKLQLSLFDNSDFTVQRRTQ